MFGEGFTIEPDHLNAPFVVQDEARCCLITVAPVMVEGRIEVLGERDRTFHLACVQVQPFGVFTLLHNPNQIIDHVKIGRGEHGEATASARAFPELFPGFYRECLHPSGCSNEQNILVSEDCVVDKEAVTLGVLVLSYPLLFPRQPIQADDGLAVVVDHAGCCRRQAQGLQVFGRSAPENLARVSIKGDNLTGVLNFCFRILLTPGSLARFVEAWKALGAVDHKNCGTLDEDLIQASHLLPGFDGLAGGCVQRHQGRVVSQRGINPVTINDKPPREACSGFSSTGCSFCPEANRFRREKVSTPASPCSAPAAARG